MKLYEIKANEKRIDVFNERWYYNHEEKEFYRSVTTILGIINKGYQFDEWLKNVGHNAEIIVDRAGTFGTLFHETVEDFLLGKTISYPKLMEKHKGRLAIDLYERFLLWVDFWKELNEQKTVEYTQEDIEVIVYNKEHKYAGTVDWFPAINDERMIFDWKTGNHVGSKEKLQLIAYMACLGIKKGVIVHIPAKKPNKKGYKLTAVEFCDEQFELFVATKKVFDMENKDQPKLLSLPLTICLDDLKSAEAEKGK